MEKEKVVYEAPAITVVEVKLEGSILASSGNAQMNWYYGEEDF